MNRTSDRIFRLIKFQLKRIQVPVKTSSVLPKIKDNFFKYLSCQSLNFLRKSNSINSQKHSFKKNIM